MTFEGFKNNINILLANGVKGVILTGGGEPTISPDFDKITDFLEQNSIPYGINTNFNLFKAIKPNYLKISLDGYDRESYQKARGVDRYDIVLTNIKEYLKYRRMSKPGTFKTSVGIQTVATSVVDAVRFYEAHKELDVDYFNIRPMESTCGKYYQDAHASNERIAILSYLQDIHEKDSRVCINYKWYEVRTQFDKCYANFSQIAINENSEVMYCCHKPYEIIGRLDDKDIWEKRERFQTNMQMCDVPCRLTAPNNFIQSLQDAPSDAAFI
jgi:MoaA/NifB/PqqE/SkfB family radical SAM enzyme